MTIRAVREADSSAIALLIGQLGYSLTPDEAALRLSAVLETANHRAWVFEESGTVLGILHAFFRPAFDNPPEVMVQTLVVEASARSKGIGEALMAKAEQWAREQGSTTVSLYSRADRSRAHQFYERLGYVKTATSARMRKVLG
jgi:GNAT superfamily N-acetyltransferase